MTIIALEHVSKTFTQDTGTDIHSIKAADDVSLKINSGDVLSILGPSGCGKSTLLRMVAGLEFPDSGRILYDNVNLREIPPESRGIGMVFQSGALMPHWEGWKTVGFFLSLRKRYEEVPERVARISRITGIGLEKLLDRRPAFLSGGERQRVAVARALTRDPRVFLFDEPFANLDAKMRGEARLELRRLLNEFPVTSIYVTHDQVEAVALSHRVAVMRAGHIEQIGAYQQLYSNPVNRFVATFIGTPTMNMLEGYVREGHWYGENFEGYPARTDLPDGTPVTLGIRPEFVKLASDGAYAVVDQVTPHFSERFLLVEVHSGQERWELALPPDEQVTVGSTIRCQLDVSGLLYFDSKTGVRIG
jgi:ABC-type sugar transport system ATPase subunit